MANVLHLWPNFPGLHTQLKYETEFYSSKTVYVHWCITLSYSTGRLFRKCGHYQGLQTLSLERDFKQRRPFLEI